MRNPATYRGAKRTAARTGPQGGIGGHALRRDPSVPHQPDRRVLKAMVRAMIKAKEKEKAGENADSQSQAPASQESPEGAGFVAEENA